MNGLTDQRFYSVYVADTLQSIAQAVRTAGWFLVRYRLRQLADRQFLTRRGVAFEVETAPP